MKKKEKNKKDVNGKKKRFFSLVFFVLILLFIAIIILSFVLFDILMKQQTKTFTQKIGVEFEEPRYYLWEPEIKGELNFVKVSGKIIGIGDVKTYLGNLLILDSSRLKSRITLTGKTIEGVENQTENLETPSTVDNALGESKALDNESDAALQPAQENTNNDSSNNTKEAVIPVREFNNVCEETCNISGLNNSSYNISVELSDAKLELDEIEYGVLTDEKAKEDSNLASLSLGDENLTPVNISELEEVKDASVETVQYKAVVGKPVKWKKTITPGSEGNLKVLIPKESEKINVKKIYNGEESFAQASVTGESIAGFDKKSLIGVTLVFVKKVLSNLVLGITGRAIEESLNLEVEIDQAQAQYEVEYETPAPLAYEIKKGITEKKITISGPRDIHYQEVLAFTELDIEVSEERIHLYSLDGNVKQEVSVDKYDTNGNGYIDYIEWTVPSLSNKTYGLVIEITNAEHLDENRKLIRDIYPQIQKNDGVWSEEISNSHYIRATFERNLTKENDIVIHARTYGNARIEVYAKDSEELIVTFPEFSGKGLYKVFLNNMSDLENYSVFDLKIIGDSVEFDYIFDASYHCEGSVASCNYYDTLGQSQCENHLNCDWSTDTKVNCTGSTKACNLFFTDSSCTNQFQCFWRHISCDNAYITCPPSATINTPFNLTFGASSQSDPDSQYPKTSIRVWSSNGSQLICNETTYHPSDGSSTGNINVTVLETTNGQKNYTVYCYADASGYSDCGSTVQDSYATCSVTLGAGSETNLTLHQGWNTFAVITSSTTSGEKNITLNNTWNLIGFSAANPLNITQANFTNSSGTRLGWTNAVVQSKFQAYLLYYEGGIAKYVAAPDLSMDDYKLDNSIGYYLKVNQRGILTLPGVGSSTAGATFNFTSLMFSNATGGKNGVEKNWTDARDANWTFMTGAAVLYLWNETDVNGGDYDTVCHTTASCDRTTLVAWRGYQIWSRVNDIVLMRRG